MEVTFYSQSSRSLRDIVKELARDSDSISIAVAYLSAEGLKEVQLDFQNIDVRIVCGVHGCISDLWALKAVAQREASFTFKNRVIDTLYKKGQQIIPTEYNNLIDGFDLIEPGDSTPFNIVLPNGSTVDGKIRYYCRRDSGHCYYEIGVSGIGNISRLRELISKNDILEYHVDIMQQIVSIKKERR